MRKFFFFPLLLWAAAPPSIASAAATTNGCSDPVPYFQDVKFEDTQHGWTVGYSACGIASDSTNREGLVYSTDDGGQHWHRSATLAGVSVVGVAFATPTLGWAVEYGGASPIIHSTDGGLSWQAQSAPAVQLEAIAAVPGDTADAWAVGANAIVHTSDGGGSWTAQQLPSGVNLPDLKAVEFTDANTGWAVGTQGNSPPSVLIVHTSDGGATWTQQVIPAPPASCTYPTFMRSVSFVNASDGWAAGGLNPLMKTTDGGVTWTYANCTGSSDVVAFGSASNGWIESPGSSGSPTIEGTTDAGVTWHRQTVPPEFSSPYAITATGGSTAFVVGSGLIGTTDAGNTWSSEPYPPIYAGYALDGWGGVHEFGGDVPANTTAYWPGWDIARGIATRPTRVDGYVLDGWGGVHPFGGAPAVAVTAYWQGWDIARGIALDPCDPSGTSGYVLDGWGGVHPFGGAPVLSASGYWPGWDIADGIAMTCDGGFEEGLVLDRWGGAHPVVLSGKAMPSTPATAYWPGWNIARGIVLTGLSGGSMQGYTLDGFGGVHGFGGLADPPISGYWQGWDIARGIDVIPGFPGGYVVDGFGGVHPFGPAPGVSVTGYWQGWDIVRGIS